MIMNCLRCLSFGYSFFCLALIATLVLTACDRQTTTPSNESEPGQVHTFTGTWSATGTRQTMKLESDHRSYIFRLTGSLLLKGKERPRKGFKADVIGFFDNRIGLQARAVWTDDRGDKVFSEIYSEGKVPGELIEGRFIGGTGRYANAIGEYTFTWKRLINNDNGAVSGRVVDLKGWVRDGSSEALPTTTGDQ